ncbi:hypothetical protein COX58_01605 [archaeon CG_4_10_14_0_2_um_filter_Archaea_38_6]|nr:MAG: hypothetical protein COX58_01605 [archaeon CG_4_10_14_0_2_um_filter_Archaea_38_6]
MQILSDKGLIIKTKNYNIGLDTASSDCDCCFLSHAHTDHLLKTDKKVLCSEETRILSKIRGREVRVMQAPKNIKLFNSGHILGSKSLLIEEDGEKILFTADFCPRTRGFMEGFKTVKCDSLIIESTFGRPYFIFPDFEEEMKKAKDFAKDNIKKDYLTVLMGYPLGKIQQIQHYFKDYEKTIHPDLKVYNDVHDSFGVNLGIFNGLEESDLLFTPLMKTNNEYFNNIKRMRGVKFAVFSGWNIIPSYKDRFSADEGFTISDHADFKELLNTVHESKAENVYVHHGNCKEFVNILKAEGINAEKV